MNFTETLLIEQIIVRNIRLYTFVCFKLAYARDASKKFAYQCQWCLVLILVALETLDLLVNARQCGTAVVLVAPVVHQAALKNGVLRDAVGCETPKSEKEKNRLLKILGIKTIK